MVAAVDRLIAGFRAFRARYYEQRPERMQELTTRGQAPEVMVIACSDSRVDPGLLLGTEPGELFMVRNVANLVPPYAPDGSHHSTSAALEFAVRDLGVRHIVILGHSACGGIEALRATLSGSPPQREFIAPWVEIAAEACRCGDDGAVPDQQTVEHDGIRISLRNLLGVPWVAERVNAGDLMLHGWWIDLNEGRLMTISPHGYTNVLVPAGEEVRGAAD